MKSLKFAIVVLTLCTMWQPFVVYAQESFVGKYTGSYERKTNRGDERYGVELNIASVENGIVKGTAIRHGRQCPGSYPIEGTMKENRLELKSGKGGTADDCAANFRLVAEGNKLKGTMGSTSVELSR